MEEKELVFEDYFEKTINIIPATDEERKRAIEYTLNEIREEYPMESGWVLGEPTFQPISEDKIIVTVKLQKYETKKKAR